MFKATLLYILFTGMLAYYHRPEFVFVAVAGFAIFMFLWVPRVAAMPKLTEADLADAWLRWQHWCIRTKRSILAKIDPELAFRRSRREHDEGALRVEREQKEAHAHNGPH